jgi:hypothetical protein
MIDHYDNWGKVDDEQKNDFISEIGSFITNLNEALSSLKCGLELRSPDAKIIRAVEVKAHRTALPPEAIDHFEALLNEWCNEIEVSMHHSCLLPLLSSIYQIPSHITILFHNNITYITLSHHLFLFMYNNCFTCRRLT